MKDTIAREHEFPLHFDPSTYRRIVAGTEVILHCHHYNSRIQRTVEGAQGIDGKALVTAAAEAAFTSYLRDLTVGIDGSRERWQVARALYSWLGFGNLDVSEIEAGVVIGTSSHFAEGHKIGLSATDGPACSFTEGFLQAAHAVASGHAIDVRETSCIAAGDEACRFSVADTRTREALDHAAHVPTAAAQSERKFVTSPNIDETAIIDALVAMPIHGDELGLIPAFNVYLACMPADFYTLLAEQFVARMDEVGLGDVAREELIHDAETCAMRTFRGIMASAEWDALIGPMIVEERDNLHGILAVSNALGWGNWHVTHYEPAQSLGLVSLNGYEADGALRNRSSHAGPACLMLTGVAAGIMELLHGVGTVDERYGQFGSAELSCRAAGGTACCFEVEEAQ